MSAPSDRFLLDTLAESIEVLSSKFWHAGDDSLSGRLTRVAELLREPLFEEDEPGG